MDEDDQTPRELNNRIAVKNRIVINSQRHPTGSKFL